MANASHPALTIARSTPKTSHVLRLAEAVAVTCCDTTCSALRCVYLGACAMTVMFGTTWRNVLRRRIVLFLRSDAPDIRNSADAGKPTCQLVKILADVITLKGGVNGVASARILIFSIL
jgi:hypothetical protein